MCALARLAGGITLTAATAVAGAQQYEITDMGALAGTRTSYATGINERNQACGWQISTVYDYHGWFWENSTMTLIPGYASLFAKGYGINDHGQVTGTMLDAFVWDKTGSLQTYYVGGVESIGYAINNHGNLAGAYLTDWTNQIERPFVMFGSHITKLPSLGGSNEGAALGLNELNHAVGWSKAADRKIHMFLYDGTMQDLGLPQGATGSAANAINESDLIAGYYLDAAGSNRAVLRDYVTGNWIMLGTLPGKTDSVAFAISDNGVVLGASGGAAFIWDETSGMRDLNTLIPAGSGWTLTSATGINSAGVIVANGTYLGAARSCVLTPLVTPPVCPGDANGDRVVDLTDLGIVLGAFGVSADGDLDGDGVTGLSDLGILLAQFGVPCP